ncbi:MAG: UvrD-helicase domain-containing protein, partial [Bacteroidales bacterium]|nr:UvrD-helicase domain-containing protein [Bacteroidales bacterium]
MENLILYSASAGSGKTYQLALNYIKLLFSGPETYQRILAVTFTNKASSEMKKRILDKLSQLSAGDPQADDYANYLIETKAAKSIEEIKAVSGKILRNILHHYSSFYVQTIDKFFQWVIRGFTREMGLQNGYSLEFNKDTILSEAVDNLIFSMGEDEELKRWLIRFAEDNVTQGKSWDFYGDILSLGQEVFKENYQSMQVHTTDPEQVVQKFNSLKEKLDQAIFQFEKSIQSGGRLALKTIEEAGLSFSDFKGKEKGIISFFKRAAFKPAAKLLPSPKNRECADNFKLWAREGDTNESLVRHLYDSSLNSFLKELLLLWDNGSGRYFTALVIRNNLYSFGILNDISEKVHEITREKNLFLISDSSLFLKNIIAGNDAPFIYEKAGNYFTHFMLDEFQDTSRFQWENFLPLIQDGLAAGNSSLIVGDVKQSIYRWRNSDWKILAGEIEDAIPPGRIGYKQLNTNFRSTRNIVAFNNSVFKSVPDILKILIKSLFHPGELSDYASYWLDLTDRIYGDPRQNVPVSRVKDEGYIRCKFEVDSGKGENLESQRNWILATIMDLQNRSYKAKDITILVRSANEGRKLAKILMEAGVSSPQKYNFNLISNDSLLVGNNPAVKYLAALLLYFRQPGDKLNTSYLKHEYLAYIHASPGEKINWHPVFADIFTSEKNLAYVPLFQSFLEKASDFRKLPLFELTETLIRFFHLDRLKDDVAYIQAFQDIILGFSRKESPDISAFLNYWGKISDKETLNVSETQDAIRIMTIHKAKGLEFKTVLIPFCNWNLEPETRGYQHTILWPSTKETGFNEFSHLPVLYGTNLRNSIFQKEYFEENCRTLVDTINLLYVAFTRAEKELHTFSFISEGKDKIKNVGEFVHAVIKGFIHNTADNDFPMADLLSGYNAEKRSFEFGSPDICQSVEKIGDKIVTGILETYPVTGNAIKLNLNHKNIYLSDLKEEEKG